MRLGVRMEIFSAEDPCVVNFDIVDASVEASMAGLTHFNEQGRARMVDVSQKAETSRVARAHAEVYMAPETMQKIVDGQIGKGDVLAVAQVAGIMAAKKNSDLIPMCHPLLLTKVDISFKIEVFGGVESVGAVGALGAMESLGAEDSHGAMLTISSEVRCQGQTGVEMEALTAVSVAALTVYDMCKAVQRDMVISNIHLTYKDGGKSGVFEAR